jgi:hypothetical protein
MATVLGQMFLDTIAIIEIDSNPTVTGVAANQGSLAIETGSGNMWRKVGANNTDWVEVFVNQAPPGSASRLRIQNGSNAVDITVPTLSSDIDLTLPGSVGEAGQKLTNQASGLLQWSNQDSFHPGIIPGKYYGSPDLVDAWTTQAVTSNRLYATPLYIPRRTNITRIGIEVTNSSVGSQARLGLYNLDNTDGEPGSLIVDGGVVATNTNGLKEAVVDVNLNPGWYYMAAAFSGTPTVRAIGVSSETMRSLLGATAPNANNQTITVVFAFDVLPNTFPDAEYSNVNRPWLWVRRV